MGKLHLFIISIFLLVVVLMTGCKKKVEIKPISDIWNIEVKGIPRLVRTNYIELSKIHRISKFRSSVGYSYTDFFENCRSMKHSFEPKNDVDWSTVKIYAPVTGIITMVLKESTGTQIEIISDEIPAFRFVIFHINLLADLQVYDRVVEGGELGTHYSYQTMPDIAVIVNDPTRRGKMISYFDVIDDAVFSEYLNRGLNVRAEMIIPKATRDEDQLFCNADTFTTTGTLENWKELN